jgi:hypothetical protein
MVLKVVGAEVTGCLVRSFGEVQEIEIDLHGRDAVEPVLVVLAGEDALVVGSDELDVCSPRC